MKKIFLLGFLGFISCIDPSSESSYNYINCPYESVREFKYKGHDYIDWCFGYGYGNSTVHNPECSNSDCIKMRESLLKLDSLLNQK